MNIRKETTTKFLIVEKDTVIDFIETTFYSATGDIVKSIWEEPVNEFKLLDFYRNNKRWYSLTYQNQLKKDSTAYYYHHFNGKMAFSETFYSNGTQRKSVYDYCNATIEKYNYGLNNFSAYELMSYEVTTLDSISHTQLVDYYNLSEIDPFTLNRLASFIRLDSFDLNDQLISTKTLAGLDRQAVINETQFIYQDGSIQSETNRGFEGSDTLFFEYLNLDKMGNWTKKQAYRLLATGEKKCVGFEKRRIEYW
jgi:hypothetical protein